MKRNRTNRVKRFWCENRRLLLFLLLPMIGCACGVPLYGALKGTPFISLLTVDRIAVEFTAILSAWWESCFQPLLLLTVLFFCGLSVCGVPAALFVPLFWGFGLGVTQAHYYAQGWLGVAVTASVILPRAVMEAVVLLMGAAECLQMSVRFAGQLLPHGARCGGLWQPFRLYLLRFLLLAALLLAAAAADVVLRIICATML